MSWFGKLAGGAIGFMLGGPLGALVGAALGHNLDASMASSYASTDRRGAFGYDSDPEEGFNQQHRRQAAFFSALFPVLGHMAKIDSRVTPDEIRLVSSLMDKLQLAPSQRQFAQRLFSSGKAADFPLDEVLQEFYRHCGRGRDLPRMFIEILIDMACIDGHYHPAEQALITHICRHLNISAQDQANAEAFVMAAGGYHQQQNYQSRDKTQRRRAGTPHQPSMSLQDAYKILGVSPTTPEAEVKKAYRRMLSRHHPDKLVAKGLPEEAMRIANQKTHNIKQAWEKIRAVRAGAH